MITTLKAYRPQQQHQGTFIAGFDWTLYSTYTYSRLPNGPDGPVAAATIDLNNHLRSIRNAFGLKKWDTACYAVLESEQKWSGVGKPRIRMHWHALLRFPDVPHLVGVVRELWRQRLGIADVVRYVPSLPGSYYMHKLVASGAPTWEYGLDKLTYTGPQDLIRAAEQNDYVPERLKNKSFGEYLRVC